MEKIKIIAEIANAHQGKIELAEKLALEAYKAKADVVKFQIYFAEELLVEKHPRFLHFKKQAFKEEEWIKLIQKTKKLGIKIYCDIFGEKALKLAKELDVDGFKIHSSDLNNKYLLNALLDIDSDKEIIISCGGSNIREIYYALNILKNKNPITLMHGFQSYPTEVEDSNLRRLDWLKRNFGDYYNIGYQDHVAGENIFATALPLLAILKGATTIEKHITLDRSAKGVDYYSSLEPKEFLDFVINVEKSISALGSEEVLFSQAEIKYRNSVKKRIVSTKEIKKGKILELDDLTFKRSNINQIETSNLENFIGKRINKNIPIEYPLSRNDIEINAWGLIIARTNSQRLNNKAVLNICGKPTIFHLFERVKKSKKLNKLVLCTTINREDDILVDLAKQNNIEFYRGPSEDVLGRMLGATNGHNPDLLIRITGDDILIDPEYVDLAITEHLKKNVEYTDLKELPSGTEVEIFDTKLLQQIYSCTNNKNDTEYLTYYITKNREHIAINSVEVNPRHNKNWRLTLDNKNDLKVISLFLSSMQSEGKLYSYTMDDIIDFFEKNPEILEINKLTKIKKTALNIDTNMKWGNLKNN